MLTDRKTSNISIIIPTRNEVKNIGRLLPELLVLKGIELIVADGGSTDGTPETAESLGVKVLKTHPGKSLQMNAGAEAARGDILLFLHCDTRLDPGFAEQVRNVINQKGVSAGAFSLAIDGKEPGLRIIEWLVNLRSKAFQMPYGDQGIFMAADMFHAVGKFPLQPIMEDFELIRRLRLKGRIKILPQRATTSARRWKRLGILKTTIINQAILLGYLFGVNPEKLAKWYGKR